jgi:hypothetical protein
MFAGCLVAPAGRMANDRTGIQAPLTQRGTVTGHLKVAAERAHPARGNTGKTRLKLWSDRGRQTTTRSLFVPAGGIWHS